MSELKQYQSHKQVWAMPMSRGEFKAHTVKKDLVGAAETSGYLVVYQSGA